MEQLLQALLNGEVPADFTPHSRNEALLYALCQQGVGGGATDAQVAAAVAAYLEENPVSGGGGSEEWELMATVDMVQDATYAKVDLPAPVKKLWVWVKSNSSSLLSNTAYLRIAVGEMAYNNHILSGAGMVHGSETWTEFQWFVDMLGNGKPRYQCYVGNKVYAGYCSNYAGPVNPSSIYITSADATGIFNANTFYVFGVRA